MQPSDLLRLVHRLLAKSRTAAAVVAAATVGAFAAGGCTSVIGADFDRPAAAVDGGGSAEADGAPACEAEADVCVGKCGVLTDNCGNRRDCGGCDAGACGGGGPNLCGSAACVPDCNGKACGASDGCAAVCTGACTCSETTCRGCCQGDVCFTGGDDTACGRGGGACVACAAGSKCGGGGQQGVCGSPGCKPSCTSCGGDDGCGGKCTAGSCPAGSHCAGTQCGCDVAGRTLCAAGCVDTSTNPQACGACDKVCSSAATCADSRCRVALGDPAITTNDGPKVRDLLHLQSVTVARAVTVTHLAVNNVDTGVAPNVVMGLYTDTGGAAGALVVQTPKFVAGMGTTRTPVAPTLLAAGTYWIAINRDADVALASGTAQVAYARFVALAFSETLPNPAPAATDLTSAFGIWFEGYE